MSNKLLQSDIYRTLTTQIAKSEMAGERDDRSNPYMNTGVTITRNEAQQCLAALEGMDRACDAIVEMAKSAAETHWDICPHYQDVPKKDFVARTWQQELTDKARAVLVAAGKIEE